MKQNQKLKIIFIILLIILISLISFGGIFVQNTKFVENIIPDYQLGMDLTGSRIISLVVSDSTNTIIYDEEGNVVEEEGDNTTTKEEPVNPDEIKTKENYLKAKETFEERLNLMNVTNYTIRLDEETGETFIQIPENSETDIIAQYTTIKGDFTVVDDESGDVLLTNNHLKGAQWTYATDIDGTTVYLIIQFNDEGTEILKNITNTYIATTDEEGKETTKTVSFKIDDTAILSTYFGQEISNGIVQFSIGSATTSNEEFATYANEASRLSVLLNTNSLPLAYTIDENRYVMSDITLDMFVIPGIVVLALIALGILFLIIAYRKNGFLCAISFIGYIAILLLIIRLTNVIITLEGIFGIGISIILYYIFIVYLLHLLKHKQSKTFEDVSNDFKEVFLKTLFILVPVAITSVVLSFTQWLPIVSFGMVIFWGILINVIYNLIITKTLIVASTKNK